MSYAEFYSEKMHTAKKLHVCDGCLSHILSGEKYLRIANKWDGDFCTAKYHPECRQYEEKLHRLSGGFPDEYMILHEAVSEESSVLDDAPQVVQERFKKKVKS